MEGYNQYHGEFEIIKKAKANIIDAGTDKDKILINVLRNEVLQLKATNLPECKTTKYP